MTCLDPVHVFQVRLGEKSWYYEEFALRRADSTPSASADLSLALSSAALSFTPAQGADLAVGSLIVFKKVSSETYPPQCMDDEPVTFLQTNSGTPPAQVKWASGFVYWVEWQDLRSGGGTAIVASRVAARVAARSGSGGGEERLKVGDRVKLTPTFASFGDASDGPLKDGDIGDILGDDQDDKPFNVNFNGKTWFYKAGALCRATSGSDISLGGKISYLSICSFHGLIEPMLLRLKHQAPESTTIARR